jgi:RNA polymerase sigma-70 factor (ECF subfamily)
VPRSHQLDPAAQPPKRRAQTSLASFDSLLAQVAEPAYGLAVCLARGEQAGGRLLQDGVLAAFRRLSELEGEGEFRIWFFRILTLTYLASRSTETARAETADLDDTPDLLLYARSGAAGYPTEGADPAARLLDTLGPAGVMAAVIRLPDDYRLVCACYFMLDLTYEEIARVLDYPVGTVRSRLHRGRKMLQKALWLVAEAEGLTTRAEEGPR